jgi:RNA polymerase sigma factor (sigma-70 family)
MMMLRKRRPERVAVYANADPSKCQPEISSWIRDSRPDPEREYIARELTIKVFNQLNPTLRHAFILHKREGWTHPELAKTLGVEAHTVKSRIFRARVRLRQELQSLTNTESMAPL